MDRPLDESQRRRMLVRRIAGALVAIGAVAGCYLLASALIAPTVSRSRIRTAIVDRGPVEAVTSASGTVVPELEQVVSSPIDTRVLRILKRPGDSVRRGDPIVELDTSATALEIEKLDQSIAIKANSQAGVRLDLDKTLADLASQVESKQLDVKSLEARVEQDRKLAAAGLMASTDLRDAELRAAKSRIELRQLEASIANAREATRTKLEGLDLEMVTLQKERAEAARLLHLATMTSDRDGVLTSVLDTEGVAVAKGAEIARVADLGSFRVDATLSDVHAQQITPGLPVKIKINDELADGHVSSVSPTIENGSLTLSVSLDDPADARLRSNLRVDVLVVTGSRSDALRVKTGPFANSSGTHAVFVVHGDRAVRVQAELGIAGVDAFEVVGGLDAGDEVIVSDMRDYAHLSEVALR